MPLTGARRLETYRRWRARKAAGEPVDPYLSASVRLGQARARGDAEAARGAELDLAVARLRKAAADLATLEAERRAGR